MKPFHSELTFEKTFDDDFPAIPDVSVPQVLTDEKITDVPEQIPVADSILRILDKKLLAVTLTTWYNLLANRCMKLHGFPARICYSNVLTLWKNSKLKGVEVHVTSSRDQLLLYSTSNTVSLPLFTLQLWLWHA